MHPNRKIRVTSKTRSSLMSLSNKIFRGRQKLQDKIKNFVLGMLSKAIYVKLMNAFERWVPFKFCYPNRKVPRDKCSTFFLCVPFPQDVQSFGIMHVQVCLQQVRLFNMRTHGQRLCTTKAKGDVFMDVLMDNEKGKEGENSDSFKTDDLKNI
ncbi:hypothetical protein CEXT_72651 [Caerostris extrusa]|uniref:Uncharacterized protein n=1 Tax=Caerostris extrusa TaxID=172846 RepID=A0AAV4NGM3_CAEEX|nr:hypothetical protein CEXT_72651 [Caerostris extrusa]